MKILNRVAFFLLLFCALARAEAPVPVVQSDAAVRVVDQEWTDTARNRAVPVRLRVPTGSGPYPVILFSHGLGGSRAGGELWGDYWAHHGYIVVHMQHPGSDESLWRGQGVKAMANVRGGMSAQNAALRVGDVGFVLDEIARRRTLRDALFTHADLRHIGMSGHSFGAQTTLTVAGESGFFAGSRADRRIKAAIAMSPAAWGSTDDLAARYAGMHLPFMSLTGTEDRVPLTPQITPENRRLPYKYMPGPDKYLLVLDGANHMVYNGQPELRRAWTAQNRQVHAPLIEEVSLDFWDAYLKGDAKARAALAPGGAFSRSLAGRGEWFAK
ncbi:MAG TPA: hypothetical protein VGN52_03380 [Burkholderiales bacterium]